MGKLEHNLDAYRQAAAALERLRGLIRHHLAAAHGDAWETDGIPDEPRQFLQQRRARENSVKWNPTSATDLLDFAGFVNLHDILNAHPRLQQGFARLAPEQGALKLRFLELDTVLNRIAYARPVSDSDMELLLGFDERLRQLAGELAAAADDPGAPPSPPPRRPEPDRHAPPPPAPAPAGGTAATAPPPAPPPAAPAPRVAAAARRADAPGAARRDPPTEPIERTQRPPSGSIPTASAPQDGAEEPGTPKDLELAIRRGDDAAVLSFLYREITGLAEKLWGDSSAAAAPAWEQVCESPWYRDRFSALRLRVVSDFYDLVRTVQDKRAAGATRGDLHELLKDRNFAQLLMDLREFFRPYLNATTRPGRG